MLSIQNRNRPASSPGSPASGPSLPGPASVAATTRASAANATTLGVSWLNNVLQVVAYEKAAVTGTWSSALSPDDVGDLGDLLREAVKQTGFSGNTLSMVLANPKLVQQLIDAPPAKGAALEAYVQRQVDQQKSQDGALAWVSQPRAHSKTGQGLLLTLLPEDFIQRLKRECQRAGLRLKAVVPVTAILEEHLRKVPRAGSDVVMIAADTNGLTSLLVARPDGELILGRSVAGGWAQHAERVAMDIKRTSLFVSQQSGQPVNGVWLFGAPAADQMRQLQSELGTSVQPFPLETSPSFWAEAAAHWPSDRVPNLIPHEHEMEPSQHLFARIAGAITVTAVIAAAVAVVVLETLARQETKNLARLKSQATELQAKHLELQRVTGDVVRRRETVRELKDNRLAPVPAWFLGQVGEIIPHNLLLSSSEIHREGNEWKFQLAGRLLVPGGTNAPGPLVIARAVKDFSARLATGPLKARMAEAAGSVAPLKGETGGNAFTRWAQSRGLNLTAQAADQRFMLEGTLQ